MLRDPGGKNRSFTYEEYACYHGDVDYYSCLNSEA